jgi:cystathionine beta-lyase
MGVRLAHTGAVAAEFAKRLVGSPASLRVLHPALPSCPGHELWQRDFTGASGVFSVVLKPGLEAALDPALSAMRLFAIGASWGGTRSLIAPMSVAADRTVTPWTASGTILRISIGLEDPADLWGDLETLFAALAQALPADGVQTSPRQN